MDEPASLRRVLFIGEHLDGQWINIPANRHTHRAPKPMSYPLTAVQAEADLSVPVPETINYRIEPMSMCINLAEAEVWTGVASTLHGSDRDLAVVRALFQRDVAACFKGAL